VSVRVLVLCADIGEGHLTIARTLRDELTAHADVEAVELRTDLDVLGPRLGSFLTRGFELHLDQLGWSYELAYRLFFKRAVGRRLGHFALAALGGRALRRAIASFGADVVVVEYPLLSAALGELRRTGRLGVPVCSSISDPAGLYYWAHPGVDLHLLSWHESLAEVERIAGPGRAAVVRPLVDRRFLEPPDRPAARAVLELPEQAPVVLVSGGGWGVGDVSGAVDVAARTTPDAVIACLAGRSEEKRARLVGAYKANPRVRVVPFTDRMPQWLQAADVLVHTTGGTTALEARVVGCPLINYGTGPAHVEAHARALQESDIALWAPDRAALGPALVRVLATERPAPLPLGGLPQAAEVVVATARREPPRRGSERLGSRTRPIAELGARLVAREEERQSRQADLVQDQ
jgi:UDP-N-acetylglucosamine:LPS N-acetylglucosamine transferase